MDWSKFDKGVFLVNVLGIIYDPKSKKILIGKRVNDPHFQGLTWCFPGGRPEYLGDLEVYLKHEIRAKTTLEVEIIKVLFAKTYPEKREFLSIYYLCEISSGKEQPNHSFKELKWISPKDIQKYFTTSIHPKLLDILKSIDNDSDIRTVRRTSVKPSKESDKTKFHSKKSNQKFRPSPKKRKSKR